MRLGLVSSLTGFFTGMLIVAAATGVLPLTAARADVENMMGIGVDIAGGDYQNFSIGVPDPALCRQACDQNNQCQGWTFVKPGVQGPTARCWLKSSLGPVSWNEGTISGTKPSGQTTGPGAARVENDMLLGVNFAGADIGSFRLSASNPVLCRQICDGRADCKAWTFVKIGSQGPTAMCWIKSAVPARSQSNATISGLARHSSGGGGNGQWGVWASASGGRWGDPCAIQYNAAVLANNRYDNNPGYRRVRTRDTQREADLDIDHFGRYHRNQPDGVVKMVPCDPNGGGDGDGNNGNGNNGGNNGGGNWTGTFEGNGFTYRISGSGNRLNVSYSSSRVDQTGTTTCTVSANRATCRGSGTYADSDKTIPYQDSWDVTLSGNTISGTWRIDQANPSWRVAPYQSAVRTGNSGSFSITRVQ